MTPPATSGESREPGGPDGSDGSDADASPARDQQDDYGRDQTADADRPGSSADYESGVVSGLMALPDNDPDVVKHSRDDDAAVTFEDTSD